MAHASIPLLSHYLRRLTARHGDPATDHELLQRFVVQREESAFTALVERHAAMVLALCRSILRNHHDAEDIFQAVFLVLARKAGSIRKGDSVGSWLYAVAFRLAHKARIQAGKRNVWEQKAATPAEQTPMDEVTWGELRDILHEEVNRLPEKYRAAVVLCYWQGRTHEQAGQQLGCAGSTIKDRLERAREMLRTRLARRGLDLSAAWFAASLSEGTTAAVSLELAQTTVRGALLFSLGQLPAGVVSAKAVACAESALRAMLVSKLKYVLALVLMLGVMGGGAGLAMLREPAAPQEQKAEQKERDRQEDPLPAGAVKRLGTLRFRHGDWVRCIALGADGESIVSAAGKVVYVWDLTTGKERRRFVGHEDEVNAVACSPDGKRIASLSCDGKILLWDVAGGKEIRRFVAHKPNTHQVLRSWQMPGFPALAFTPDGREFISRGGDNSIRLWDAATGEKKREFYTFSFSLGPASALGFVLSLDGKLLASLEGKIEPLCLKLREVATGRVLKEWAPKGCICGAAFSPDGKSMAVCVGPSPQQPSELELWDVAQMKKIRSFSLPEGEWPFAFSPDGKTLVSRWWTGARLRDVQSGKILVHLHLEHPPTSINQILFCRDGKTLVSYSHGEHSLRLWDRASGKELAASYDAVSSMRCAFSPNGRFLALGSQNGTLRLWDVSANKELWRSIERPPLYGMLFSPDSQSLVANNPRDDIFRIREVASGKEVRQIKKAGAYLTSMAWSGDGKLLATWPLQGAGQDCLVQLWDTATGQEVHRLNAGVTPINFLVFSPDSQTLLAAGNRSIVGEVLRWRVNTGWQLPSLEWPVPGGLKCLAFSPDGRTVAGGAMDRTIYLWEVVSGHKRAALNVGEIITSLAYSPDGKVLAAASNTSYRYIGLPQDGVCPEQGKFQPPRVHLWNLAAETELPALEGHQGSITSLSFAPDGKLLATGSNDTTALLWDTTRFKTNGSQQAKLSPEQLASLWADLLSEDAVKAYRAVRALAAAPYSTVAFFKHRLRPVAPADSELVAGLLADLDSAQFAVREKAMQQLEKLGERTATELRKALDRKPTLEVKRRIEQLLEKQTGAEHIRMVRALETLESIGTAEVRDLCAKLAEGVADAPLTREARATLRRMTCR